MKSQLKTAILVLNDVIEDARVLKQYQTLRKSGVNAKILAVNSSKGIPSGSDELNVTYLNTRLLFRSLILISFFSLIIVSGTIVTWESNSTLRQILFFFFLVLVTLSLSCLALIITNLLAPKTWYSLRRRYYPAILKLVFKIFSIAILAKDQPSIVHCHDLNTLSIGTLFKKIRRKTRLIFDAHEIYPHLYGLSEWQSQNATNELKRLLQKVDILITINSDVATYYKNQFNFKKNILVVHNSPPREEPVNSANGDKKLIHKYFHLTPEKRILLYQGGLSEGRGLDHLVASSEFFPKNWLLVVMGWGPIGPRLKSVANEKNILNKKVFFRSAVEQTTLKLWSSSANIGVIPYKNNCMNHQLCSPNKLWEYPSSGLPIISEDLPYLRKVIQGEGIGWLTTGEYDPMTLGKLLGKLSESEIDSKSQAAKKFFYANSWEKDEPVLLKAYSNCID